MINNKRKLEQNEYYKINFYFIILFYKFYFINFRLF